MGTERLEQLEEIFAEPLAALRQFLSLQNFDVLECRGARNGLATEGKEMRERHILLLELIVESLADRNGGDRRVSGRDALRHGHQIRHDTKLLGGEHRAGAAEAVNDLVHDQKNAM